MKDSGLNLEYREYCLSDDFPVLMLTPQSTKSTSAYTTAHYHFHNCLEIGICYEGNHTLSFENVEYELSAGTFFIISPYSMHFLFPRNADSGNSCKYLYIKPEELLSEFYPLGLPDEAKWYMNSGIPFIFTAENEPDIYHLLNLIVRELSLQQDYYEFAVKGLILSLITKLTTKLTTTEEVTFSRYQSMSQVLPALKFIHNHHDKPITISYLASICNMSTSGFRALFSELMSETPRHYLNRIRLQRACELLYSTEKTILDISIESGFQSLSNFYRAFHDYYGVSPKEWRDTKRSIQKKNIRHSQFSPD